jgi:hypothetical protein
MDVALISAILMVLVELCGVICFVGALWIRCWWLIPPGVLIMAVNAYFVLAGFYPHN